MDVPGNTPQRAEGTGPDGSPEGLRTPLAGVGAGNLRVAATHLSASLHDFNQVTTQCHRFQL